MCTTNGGATARSPGNRGYTYGCMLTRPCSGCGVCSGLPAAVPPCRPSGPSEDPHGSDTSVSRCPAAHCSSSPSCNAPPAATAPSGGTYTQHMQ